MKYLCDTDADTDVDFTEVYDYDDDGGCCKSLGGRGRRRQVRRIFLLREEKLGPVITGTLAASYLILLSRPHSLQIHP